MPVCPNVLANLLQNLSSASAKVGNRELQVVPEEVSTGHTDNHHIDGTISGDSHETSSAQWEFSENGRP
ncbi:MAG: hypothetical protein JWQ42_4516 [Edaphobacter sp.]|nr:hypothetical protein [Edaphobacter sp.]